MSNHYHAVVTDTHGRLPDFTHWLHLYVAKCINAVYGRWENFWASEPPSAVRLEDDEDVLDKIAYCLANPVLASLVECGAKWPGLRSQPQDITGTTYELTRPPVFFRPDGPMPDKVELRFSRPDIHRELTDEQLADLVKQTVESREATARAKVAREGRRFAGVKAVLKQRPSGSPMTIEPRRQLKPRVGAHNRWLRMESLQRLESFLNAYRAAYERFREGTRDVVFPPGTYALRLRHCVAVADTS